MTNSKPDPQFCDRLHLPLIKEIKSIKLLINEREKQVNIRFDNIDKALVLARDQLDLRLESMNEIRAQLERQANTFISDDKFESLSEKVNSIDKIVNMRQGSSKWSDHIVTVLIGIAVVIIIYLIMGQQQ